MTVLFAFQLTRGCREGGWSMPRKPNYRFERAERERAKAKKKAKHAEEKAARKEISSNADDQSEKPISNHIQDKSV